jgi:polyisoprenoid-binding protein YceI
MHRLRHVAVAVLVAAAIPAGTAGAQGVIVERSEIRFVARQLGAAVEGRFRKWRADVAFLPQDLAHSKVVVDVDLGSIDLASEDTERELRAVAWFDTAKFPVAHFASTSIVERGDGRYEIAGELSIKGFARPVVVPVALRSEAGGNRVAEGSFGLKRLDFKVGEGQWADTAVVANEVTVRIRMVLTPPK